MIAANRRARRRTPRITVALVGADGAGKSSVSRRLEHADLPLPVKTVYMGVNVDASSLMLPTTRLLLAAKKARGGRPDLVAGDLRRQPMQAPTRRRGDWRRAIRDSARLSVWMAEEWLRQAVAAVHTRRGFLVVFDRHFYADYYDSHVATGGGGIGLFARLHGWMLHNAYPKPDLLICLDAPAEVLFARKPESGVDWLAGRRQEYLQLESVVPTFERIDADRPFDEVVDAVIDAIARHVESRRQA